MKTEEGRNKKRACHRGKGRDVGWSREVKKQGGKQTGEGRTERKMEGGGKDLLVT